MITATLTVFQLKRKGVWKHGSQGGNGGNVVRFGITKTDASYYGLGRFQSMQRCRGDVTGKTCWDGRRADAASLQVALLGVAAGYGVQPPVLVQSLGPVGFVVDVVSDLLQVLEVRPGGHTQHQQHLQSLFDSSHFADWTFLTCASNV